MNEGPNAAGDCGTPTAACGARISGNWTLGEVLGKGGTATVYRATRDDGTVAAAKVLHCGLAGTADWSRRLLREAELLSSMSHPGLVRPLGVELLGGATPVLMMELLDGESLDTLLERAGGRLPQDDVVRYGSAILEVLAHAHDRGVVHRDLKPSNVFVTSHGRVKVLDFGIASARTSSLTVSGRSATQGILGTPAYMAPEQARGRWDLVDARTDVWAAGAMCFTLLTGEPVHLAQTENERLGLAMSRRARSIRSLSPGLDRRLSAVVDQALCYEPESRFQTARAFRDALLHLSDTPNPSARSLELTLADAPLDPGQHVRSARAFGRKRELVFGFGAALALLVSVAATLPAQRSTPPPPPPVEAAPLPAASTAGSTSPGNTQSALFDVSERGLLNALEKGPAAAPVKGRVESRVTPRALRPAPPPPQTSRVEPVAKAREASREEAVAQSTTDLFDQRGSPDRASLAAGDLLERRE